LVVVLRWFEDLFINLGMRVLNI